jgi:DoxX-like family
MQLNSTWSLIVTIIPALLVIASGVFKLSGSKQIVDALTKVGVINYIRYLGIAEIIFAILFIFPPTNSIGFILLACYFSGAIATDLSHKNSIVAPVVILSLIFIAEILTNNNLFLL